MYGIALHSAAAAEKWSKTSRYAWQSSTPHLRVQAVQAEVDNTCINPNPGPMAGTLAGRTCMYRQYRQASTPSCRWNSSSTCRSRSVISGNV